MVHFLGIGDEFTGLVEQAAEIEILKSEEVESFNQIKYAKQYKELLIEI